MHSEEPEQPVIVIQRGTSRSQSSDMFETAAWSDELQMVDSLDPVVQHHIKIRSCPSISENLATVQLAADVDYKSRQLLSNCESTAS